MKPYVGTAGWALPQEFLSHFPDGKSNLARYAQRFNTVEINSSFYREHMAGTYQRWAQEVPDNFRFSIKLSKKFSHDSGLKINKHEIQASLQNIQLLGEKLGVLLVQFPGKKQFELKLVSKTFDR